MAINLTKQVFRLHGYQIGAIELPDHGMDSALETVEENIPEYLVSRDGVKWDRFMVRCGPEKNLSHETFTISDHDLSIYVINVSNKAVKCITLKELAEGDSITANSPNHLADRHELKLNRDKTMTLCDYIGRFVHEVR